MKKNNLTFKSNLSRLNPEDRIHKLDTIIIGLTGGIGTGKTTASKILQRHGAKIIDADKCVKNIYAKGLINKFLSENIPETIANNKIDFSLLREIIFNNKELRNKIELEIYKHLPAEFSAAYEALGRPPVIFYDVPLLFEKGIDSHVDVSLCIYAPKELQIQRVLNRDNSKKTVIESIINSQMDIEEKKRKSDYVIDNSRTESDLEKNIISFLDQVKL